VTQIEGNSEKLGVRILQLFGRNLSKKSCQIDRGASIVSALIPRCLFLLGRDVGNGPSRRARIASLVQLFRAFLKAVGIPQDLRRLFAGGLGVPPRIRDTREQFRRAARRRGYAVVIIVGKIFAWYLQSNIPSLKVAPELRTPNQVTRE
jgi:hypothetical protein